MTNIVAGCKVKHLPTGETWWVLGVDGRGNLCVAGWPNTIAKITDCEFISSGQPLTEQELTSRQRMFGEGWT